MKKQELLNMIDETLLDALYGYCYPRTRDSYAARELCSDIVYALVKAANTDGEIAEPYAFIWRVARNVYADYCKKRSQSDSYGYMGDPDTALALIADEQDMPEDDTEQLRRIYQRIAYLTRAYREVMIAFYLDGKPIAQIATEQGVREVTIRQRLYSARKKLKDEVETMTQATKPVALNHIEYNIIGTGNPNWGDPRDGFWDRDLSAHVLHLCHRSPKTASEIAAELNVPTLYIEQELEILTRGRNGEYGLLRRLDNGRYGINFVLFDKPTMEKAITLYEQQLPMVTEVIAKFIEDNKQEYLSFPYLNKYVDLNLILWEQLFSIAYALQNQVTAILETKYFQNDIAPKRPFSVFGFESIGRDFGCGMDGTMANCICDYSRIGLTNIYISRIRPHFHCGHNISQDPVLLMTIRAIEGLNVNTLYENEKEFAAKAIEQGLILREGDMLYTKILVHDWEDGDKLFAVSDRLASGYFDKAAEAIAQSIAELIRATLPEYLMNEWRHANRLASLPMVDALAEALIERGILTAPVDGIGAEGCFMEIEK